MQIHKEHKNILDKVTDQLIYQIWDVIKQALPEERYEMRENKFANLKFFGGLISASYLVEHFSQSSFNYYLTECCKALYEEGDYSKTPLYKAVFALRKIWEGDKFFLSKNMQLHMVHLDLPNGREIRKVLRGKFDEIATGLIEAQQRVTFDAKVAYVENLLTKHHA